MGLEVVEQQTHGAVGYFLGNPMRQALKDLEPVGSRPHAAVASAGCRATARSPVLHTYSVGTVMGTTAVAEPGSMARYQLSAAVAAPGD